MDYVLLAFAEAVGAAYNAAMGGHFFELEVYFKSFSFSCQ